MTKAVPDGRANLLEFQLPTFERALNDKKSFAEAVAIAEREPWPEGMTQSHVTNVRFYACHPEDKEGETRKRDARIADARAAKMAEKKKKAANRYDPETDAIKVTVHYIDAQGKVIRTEIETEGASYPKFAKRLLGRTDVVTWAGDRQTVSPLKVLIPKVRVVDSVTGQHITFTRLDISPEVRQALRLTLQQRKVFGAAKDRGLSDADALALAKSSTP